MVEDLHYAKRWTFGLYYYMGDYSEGDRRRFFIDPENFGPDIDGNGPDRGLPVYWDGKTNLDVMPEKRIIHLGNTFSGLEKRLENTGQISIDVTISDCLI